MKIISGKYKGKVIKGYDLDGTRPTMDRVKESVFAIIQNKVKDSIVLDLFSGSGNLGIEALSNYSKYVYFNDYSKSSCKVILDNLKSINENNYQVLNLDYLKCLDKLKDIKFDLIFLDPPYKLHVLNNILEYIWKNDLLNIDGLVIVEYQDEDLKSNLTLIKEKKYGDKKVNIYRKD